MNIEVIEATLDDKPVIRHLMELYQHDLSEFGGEDVNEHGLFGYNYLDNYWVEDGRFPLLIRVGGKLGGFVLVAQHSYTEEGEYCIAEFFVLRKYRRKGVGRKAAQAVFDKFPVTWEVQQMGGNHTAQSFWRNVIEEYTGNGFKEYAHGVGEWEGPIQVFRSNRREVT